jgi:hypothetical protein
MPKFLRVAVLLPMLLLACGPSPERKAAEQSRIDALLKEYLPKLAQAYSTQDAQVLKPLAAEKEIASVAKRIQDLADQGRVLKPSLRSFTIEDLQVWNVTNAYVTTVEIWDLHVFAMGTDTELSKELEQSNRVKYQLKRENDRWIVLYRTILE